MSGLVSEDGYISTQRLTQAVSDDQLILTFLHSKAFTTIGTYSTALRQFQAVVKKPLIKITLEDLQEWVLRMQTVANPKTQKTLSISTINKKIAIVKSLFSFASTIGYLKINAAKLIKSVKSSKFTEKQSLEVTERIVTETEVKAIIGAAKTERDRVFLLTIYLLGLRVHEAINLHWDCVTPSQKGGYRVKIIGKGGSVRYNLIPEKLLNEWKSLGSTGYIFQSNRNKQLGRTRAHLIMKAAVRNAKLDSRVSLHWLRHAHASHSLKNGASLKSVQQQLGHSSIAITSVYLHDSESSSDYLMI